MRRSGPVKVLERVLEVGEVVLRLRLPHEAPYVGRLHLEDFVGVLQQGENYLCPNMVEFVNPTKRLVLIALYIHATSDNHFSA